MTSPAQGGGWARLFWRAPSEVSNPSAQAPQFLSSSQPECGMGAALGSHKGQSTVAARKLEHDCSNSKPGIVAKQPTAMFQV